MTYLPELQRILVSGAARLEQVQLEVGAVPARGRHSGSRLVRALRRLTRGRLFVFAGLGLLAAGSTAAALVELAGRQSAAPRGQLSSRLGQGSSLQVASGDYAVSVTPDLQAGGVGWCVSAQAHVSGPIGGDLPTLRAALAARRARLETSLNRDERALSPRARSILEHEVNIVIPGLLKTLSRPGGIRNSLALRSAYRELLGTSGGKAARCGVAAQRGSPIVAEIAQASVAGRGAASVHTSTLVFITQAEVVAVRASRSLTLITRSDRQLPRDERVAIAVQQTLGKPTQLPLPPRAPVPIGLDRQGRAIRATAKVAFVNEPATDWQSASSHPGSAKSGRSAKPPPGACEINTSGLRGAAPLHGAVVQHIRGFPQLVADAYLSCANTDLLYQHKLIIAAILVDARHPGERPAALPDATEISRQPQLYNVPIGTQTLTARRVGDTWLVIETSAGVSTRVAVLRGLAACVRLTGRCR